MNVLTDKELRQVKSIFTTAGKRLLKLRGAKRLAAKNVGHATTAIVTQADIDTENFLKHELGKAFPTIGFYSEETAKESTHELEKERVWICDPIDGTLNFARGLPLFAVGAGLYVDGKPAASFIYLPVFAELYWAIKHQGAYCNQKQISVVTRVNPQEIMPTLSFLGLDANQQNKLFAYFAKRKIPLYRLGSAHYDATAVASGGYDVWIGINQALWDMAPAQTLITEAGGAFKMIRVDEAAKSSSTPYHWWFITGNPTLVKELAPELKKI